jgi:hypothetical protein
MKLPRSFRLFILVILGCGLPLGAVHGWEEDLVPVASYVNSPEVNSKEGARISALLAERGIRGLAAGSAGMTFSVPAERSAEALRILAEAKRKEGLRLDLILNATKLAEWPEGARLKPELKLTAILDAAGKVAVSGELRIANPREEILNLQAVSNRSALAFLVFDSQGNPFAPVMRGKADPAYAALNLAPQAAHLAPLANLDFVTGSAWAGYDLKRGGSYRVIAVYRPAGKDGPGFSSDEVRLKIPE